MAFLSHKVGLEVFAWRFSPRTCKCFSQSANTASAVKQEIQSRLELLPALGMSWSLPSSGWHRGRVEEHVPGTVTLLRPAETVTDPVAVGCVSSAAARPFRSC